jgi:hypothetical protein
MIERTHRRLRQARFFYEHLLNPRHSTKGNSETFRYYFSAFILSARTVTWTLKKEEKKKWEAWKPKWEANLSKEEQKLLKVTRGKGPARGHMACARPSKLNKRLTMV